MIHFITICATNKHNKEMAAIDLYKGGYWNIVKEISKLVNKTWIISTKYGLIESTKKIKPYSMSFKPDSQDYVGHNGSNPTEYWDKEHKDEISNLIKSNPNDKFIVYCSFAYIKAVKNDLLKVIKNNNVYLFSPDTKGKEYEPYILKTSLKMKDIIGGNKITITALTVKHFIENQTIITWNKEKINKYFIELVKDCKEYEYKKAKEKVGDDEIKKLIKEAGIDKGKTTILKFISNKNIACGPNRLNKLLYEMRKQ